MNVLDRAERYLDERPRLLLAVFAAVFFTTAFVILWGMLAFLSFVIGGMVTYYVHALAAVCALYVTIQEIPRIREDLVD